MLIYRYSSESIDSLTRRMRRHHLAGFMIFTAALCSAGVVLFGPRAGTAYGVIAFLVMGGVWVKGSDKATQRVVNLLRSTEIEIDDDQAVWRSKLSNRVLYRSDIVEANFSSSGIWLRGRSRRSGLQLPPELEGFDRLSTFLDEWLPQETVRRRYPPSSAPDYLRLYGTWTGAAAMAVNARVIAIPACVLAGTGIAWYFAWCGRKIDERKWKVLLPLSGYFFGAALLIRALTLWVSH